MGAATSEQATISWTLAGSPSFVASPALKLTRRSSSRRLPKAIVDLFIVDLFEVIEIDERHGERFTVFVRGRECLAGQLLHAPPIR